MQITRRRLAAALCAPAAALAAQTSAPVPSPDLAAGQPDPMESARRQIRDNAAALAGFDLPMATEPAFRFEA